MSDLLASELAPEWDADDEKTFYELIADIERVREETRLIDLRMAQDRAESRIYTERADRTLAEIRRAREEFNASHQYKPRYTEGEAAEIDRENAFLRAEIARLRQERNLSPLFEDFLTPPGIRENVEFADKG